MREKKDILENYTKISSRKQPIYLTTYSISEIFFGFYDKEFEKHNPEKLKLQKELFNRMIKKLIGQQRVICLSYDDSKVLGKLLQLLKVKGTPIPIMDAIIGSIAYSRNLCAITTDKSHFEVIEETLEDFEVHYW